MLLRAYRLTDRLGMLLLKVADFLQDWLFGSASSLVVILRRVLGAVVGVIVTILTAIVGLLWAILRGFFYTLRILFSGGSVVAKRIGAGGRQGVGQVSNVMARRAAQSDVDVIITEDPLKVQNRRLSMLVLALGAIAVVAILFATDQSRTNTPLASVVGVGADAFILNATPIPTQEGLGLASIATPIPTATTVPEVLQVGGTIAFTVRERGQTDIWAVEIGSRTPVRLISSATDDRDPMWNLQGNRLSFASHRDGNWELYFFDLDAPGPDPSANVQRLTYDLAFQASPSWSDDGQWIVSESYQDNNLDIVARRIDGSSVIRLTNDPAPDFSPVWSPTGRQVAFVSWREGNQDIYLFDLDSQTSTNLTQTPNIHEDYPAWSPDGNRLAYSAWEQGREQVYVIETRSPGTGSVVSLGRTPTWSPDGSGLAYIVDSVDGNRAFIYVVPYGSSGAPLVVSEVPYGAMRPTWVDRALPPAIVNSGGVELAVAEPLYQERVQPRSGAPVGLQSIPDTQAQNEYLSDAVNDSFNALRERLLEESGWDFMAQMDDLFWDINRLGEPGVDNRNWHKTGRAFSIDSNALLGFPPEIEIVREDVDPSGRTYWRVFLRVDDDMQSGQLGEPLRRMPWNFLSQNQDLEAYNQGGRLRAEVPSGYYIDFTQIAADYGWQRFPAGSDWRANANTRFFWMFYKPDNLSWLDAMLEIYEPAQLGGYLPTPTPSVDSQES